MAKADLAALGHDLDLLDTYNLLGDPATALALPALSPPPTPTPTPTPNNMPLAAFSARQGNDVVVVKWQTSTEQNLLGFNLWRATKKGNWRKLTPDLIPAQHANTPEGAKYRWRDARVKPGGTYRYKLELVGADGTSLWSKIVRVRTK